MNENTPSEKSLEEILQKLKETSDPAYLPTVSMNDLYENVYRVKPPVIDASLNKIHSNIRQIARHRRTRELDAEAAAQMVFLADKLCEEVYLLAAQK